MDKSKIVASGTCYCVFLHKGEVVARFGCEDGSMELFDTLIYDEQPDEYRILGFYGEPYNSQPFVHRSYDNAQDAIKALAIIDR